MRVSVALGDAGVAVGPGQQPVPVGLLAGSELRHRLRSALRAGDHPADGTRPDWDVLHVFVVRLFAMVTYPLGGAKQIGICFRKPGFVAGVEVVVPRCAGVSADVVPGRPAADGWAVPLAIIVD